MVAVGLQSIGYCQFYARVFERIGIEALEEDNITGLFLCKEDADKLYRNKERRRNEDVKIERMRRLALPKVEEGRGGKVEGRQ